MLPFNCNNENKYQDFIAFSGDGPVHKKIRFDPSYSPTKPNHSTNQLSLIIGSTTSNSPVSSNLFDKNICLFKSEKKSSEDNFEWFYVFDNARSSGNTTELMAMIEDGLLSTLDEEEIEVLFSYSILNKKTEILYYCAKHGLCDKDRIAIWELAVALNYYELAEAAFKGAPNQSPIKISLMADVLTHFNNLKNRGKDERIIQLISTSEEFMALNTKEYEWRKYLGNLCGVEGKFLLDNKKHDYFGCWIHFFTDPILSALTSFQNDNPTAIDDNLLKILLKVIDDSRNVNETRGRLYTYRFEGNPIIIHAGKADHQIEIVLWKNYLLICNKGLFSKVPILVYTIDPSLVKQNLFQATKNILVKRDDKSAKKFYAHTLPKLLNAVPHKLLTNLFTKEWMDETLEQEMDNCVWESLRTALFGIAGMHAWIKNGCDNKSDRSFLEKTMAKSLNCLLAWDNYVGLHSLGEYIEFSHKEPSDMDRKLAVNILSKAKDLVDLGDVDFYHYTEIVGKYIRARSRAIEIEDIKNQQLL